MKSFFNIIVVSFWLTTTSHLGVSFQLNSPSGRLSTTTFVSQEALLADVENEEEIQWDLFQKHHARGSWKGIWTTYDYMGDVIDETIASVDLDLTSDEVQHTHQIVVGAKRSDCATCFDSMDVKSLPVATYTKGTLLPRKTRLAACGMVNGPRLLRNGAMATELILSHGDGRIRVVLQHAPVWEEGMDPSSGPPSALKLFRSMVSREALRSAPPTAEAEKTNPPESGNPIFFRPVSPFKWHKQWSGTSWTWGPSSGNRGWSIDSMEEGDSWHGLAPVETWNLRMGSVVIQAPRLVTDDMSGLCRLAWLPDDDTLLRIEAGVQALQPMELEDETLIGFEPPSLSSLRCDMMKNIGDLEGEPQFVIDQRQQQQQQTQPVASPAQSKEDSVPEKATPEPKPAVSNETNDEPPESGLEAIRNAIQL